MLTFTAMKFQGKKSKANFNLPVMLMFLGLFFGIFTFAFIGKYTFVSKFFLSKLLAFFCFIGLLFPMKFYKKWFNMGKEEAIFFNVLGFGPAVCSVLLWLNFLIRTNEKEETFGIRSAKVISSQTIDNIDVIFTLENDTVYTDYQEFRTVPIENGDLEKVKAKKLKIKTAEGLLGYRVFLGNETITE